MLDKSYWKKRWDTGETGWDTGKVTTPIREFVDYLIKKKADRNTKILIPGAGSGHEAAYFYEQGFHNITICEWAEEAVFSFKKICPQFPDNQIVINDFFDLNGSFDMIVEQTFFCALPPSMRPQYAQKCFELLDVPKPYDETDNPLKGVVCGVLFGKHFDFDGPPFGGTVEEYKEYFNVFFDIKKIDNCFNSIKPRENNELWFYLRKKWHETKTV